MKSERQKVKDKAFSYYCKGLNSVEIAKLLDLNFRTVQNWIGFHEWKKRINPTPEHQKAYDLRLKGFSYNDIAKVLNISRSTAYKWVKMLNK